MAQEKRYFGTDGIRGVANIDPLTPQRMVQLGRALAKVFLPRQGHHRILIGKDTRLSGYMIEASLAAGITSMGLDVLLVGPLPTPGVAYLTKSMRVDAGVVISASHNPFEDNGIKIFGADGYKLPDSTELEIEDLLDLSVNIEPRDASSLGKAYRIDDALGRYTVYLKTSFPREFTLEGLRVGLDCANGAAYSVAPQTLEELGAEVLCRGNGPNGRNINAGFGSLYPEVVRKLVLENNLDVGIALDGDADRALLVDEQGNFLDGDMVLAITAIDLKERGLLRVPKVVGTVMSNLGLEKFLRGHGIEVERTQVGDRYVLERMLEIGSQVGGEQSGHTIFTDHSTTGDGMLTALTVLEIMFRRKRKLSELVAGFVKFPQKLINIRVSSKPDLRTVPEIRKVLEQKENELRDNGRILVRYSGTENKARVMVECEEEELCKRHATDVAEVIERAIGKIV